VTIIAYRNGTIACDSCWNDDGLVFSSATKIIRLPYGKLYGASGDCDDRMLLDLLRPVQVPAELPTKKQLEELDIDVSALLVFKPPICGPLRVFVIDCYHLGKAEESSGITEVHAPFCAVGSGRKTALGAMAHGASAAEAVQVACDLDIYCRPPIHVLKVD
jgi:hypothetical protein